MSYLARLKQEKSRNATRGELTEPTEAPFVGFVSTAKGAPGDISQVKRDQWREFETLLAIVAPAYNTPALEYAEMREAAARDLASAILCFRILAQQVGKE